MLKEFFWLVPYFLLCESNITSSKLFNLSAWKYIHLSALTCRHLALLFVCIDTTKWKSVGIIQFQMFDKYDAFNVPIEFDKNSIHSMSKM